MSAVDHVIVLPGGGYQGHAPHEAEPVAAWLEGLGVAASVEFPGPTSDLETALTGASIFALSSREEGFPMSIIEAMAYGLPTVAFDCAPGVRELLTDGHDGLVVTPGNVTAFAAALERLMDDEHLRDSLGDAAGISVRRYAPDIVIDRWERTFTLVTERAARTTIA